MRVAIIGCGYVFDHYMATWKDHPELEIRGVADVDAARLRTVANAYDLPVYASNEQAYADETVDTVVNLTSIESHVAVSSAALRAGKHVFSEKPLAPTLDEASELVELAEDRGLRLACAPSNAMSPTMQTVRAALREGLVGTPRLVYAEFDDNPIHLMEPQGWRSPTGAPWPYLHEYEMGCTWEHAGYHLTWLCAMFGPVRTVTAFSKVVVPEKSDPPMATPDFSVACLDFDSGVVARLTCSIAAPLDHSARIIGEAGMLSVDTYRDYDCPVRFEAFGKVSLNARKAATVRRSSALRRVFGAAGSTLDADVPTRRDHDRTSGSGPRAWLSELKRRELGQQDKVAGIAELGHALAASRPHFPGHAFTLHVTELTLAIQAAGTDSHTHGMATSFASSHLDDALGPPPDVAPSGTLDRLRGRVLDGVLDRLHAH